MKERREVVIKDIYERLKLLENLNRKKKQHQGLDTKEIERLNFISKQQAKKQVYRMALPPEANYYLKNLIEEKS